LPLGFRFFGSVQVVELLPPALGQAGPLSDRDALLRHLAVGFDLDAFVLEGPLQRVVGQLLCL